MAKKSAVPPSASSTVTVQSGPAFITAACSSSQSGLTAPKSNATTNAVYAAMDQVGRKRVTIPPYLQDAHYGGHEKLGRGIGYKYAHDFPGHWVDQQYLPDEVKDERFLILGENGYEKQAAEHMKRLTGKDLTEG